MNDQIDRFMNRELHPEAARALAQKALDDTDLYEELTAVALVQAALESPATTDRELAQAALDDEDLFDTLVARGAVAALDPASVRAPRQRRHWPIVAAGVGAIAAGLLTFFVLRPSSSPVPQARVVPSKPAVAPTILLAADLQPAGSNGSPVFRGADSASRAPKSEGTIVSMEDGIATVNLGSLDGMAKGTELPVGSGRIIITTVFRDRARGNVTGSDGIRVNSPVHVLSAVHLKAILQQVDSLAASGDLKAARDVARNAISSGSAGEERRLLEQLAALDYQAGAPDAARDHYEVAVNNFDEPPAATQEEQASTLASYGALLLLNGDSNRSEEHLQKALGQAQDPTLRSQILNNLGAIAEIRGDQAKAADYYRRALREESSNAERAAVESNLARVNHP